MVRQYKPMMRMNNQVMMTINPDPVHLTLEDVVDDLTYRAFDYAEKDEIMMMTKKELKDTLRQIANYRAYHCEGYEISYHNGSNYGDCETEWLKVHSAIKAKVLKVFPEFETEQNMPEAVQEQYA